MMDGVGDLLEAYLDGLLLPAERPRFESRLQQDSSLAGQIACQRRIDASLERLFVPAPLDHLATRIAAAALAVDSGPSWLGRYFRFVAAAAAIALFAAGGLQIWSAWRFRQRPDPYAPQPWRSVSQVYEDAVHG